MLNGIVLPEDGNACGCRFALGRPLCGCQAVLPQLASEPQPRLRPETTHHAAPRPLLTALSALLDGALAPSLPHGRLSDPAPPPVSCLHATLAGRHKGDAHLFTGLMSRVAYALTGLHLPLELASIFQAGHLRDCLSPPQDALQHWRGPHRHTQQELHKAVVCLERRGI